MQRSTHPSVVQFRQSSDYKMTPRFASHGYLRFYRSCNSMTAVGRQRPQLTTMVMSRTQNFWIAACDALPSISSPPFSSRAHTDSFLLHLPRSVCFYQSPTRRNQRTHQELFKIIKTTPQTSPQAPHCYTSPSVGAEIGALLSKLFKNPLTNWAKKKSPPKIIRC